MTSAVVLYHHPCHDGIFAALAAHLHFRSQPGASVRYLPHRVYEALDAAALSLTIQDHVYLLDYAGPPGFVEQLGTRASRVIVLDHHKTAFEQFGRPASGCVDVQLDNCTVHLDMRQSGATLALEHFQPAGLTDALRKLFNYIEDADLWRWRLPHSREFNAGLVDMRDELDYNTLTNPDIFDQLLRLTPDAVIERGRRCIAEQDKTVAGVVAASFPVRLGGASGEHCGWGSCLAVRADDASNLRSQIGSELAAKSRAAGLRAIGAVIYIEAGMGNSSVYKVSLRSLGEEDTTPISSALGGGGHRNASSFTASVQDVDKWRIQS